MLRRLRLALDRRVTVSNLLDELLRRGDNRVVSIEEDFVTLDGLREPVQRVADVHREVCALGRFLVEDVGLRPGGLVGIWRTNDTRCLRWFLAVIRAGGIAVPLNPLLSLPEARRIVGHCGLDVLVTDRAHFEERIGSRDQLPVPVWIQSDNESGTLDGFLRVPPGQSGPAGARGRVRGAGRTRGHLPHVGHGGDAESRDAVQPRAAGGTRWWPGSSRWCSATATGRWSRCRGRTSWL